MKLTRFIFQDKHNSFGHLLSPNEITQLFSLLELVFGGAAKIFSESGLPRMFENTLKNIICC